MTRCLAPDTPLLLGSFVSSSSGHKQSHLPNAITDGVSMANNFVRAGGAAMCLLSESPCDPAPEESIGRGPDSIRWECGAKMDNWRALCETVAGNVKAIHDKDSGYRHPMLIIVFDGHARRNSDDQTLNVLFEDKEWSFESMADPVRAISTSFELYIIIGCYSSPFLYSPAMLSTKFLEHGERGIAIIGSSETVDCSWRRSLTVTAFGHREYLRTEVCEAPFTAQCKISNVA